MSKLAKDIRVAIDMNNSSDSLSDLGDVDTLTTDEVIRSKVLEAIRRVHMAAPVELLEQGHNFGDAIYWRDEGSGYVLLPDDFMRLVVFEMSDWEIPVYHAITVRDPEYRKQRSRHRGVRGTPQRPVCALVQRPVVVVSQMPEGRALEFYSCADQSADVVRAVYIPYPSIDKNDSVDISEMCYRAVVYTAASLALTTIGEADKAAAMLQIAQTMLQ